MVSFADMENEWLSSSVVSTSVAMISSTVLTSSGMTSGVMSVGQSNRPPPEDRSLNHHPAVRGGFMDGGGIERPMEQALQVIIIFSG